MNQFAEAFKELLDSNDESHVATDKDGNRFKNPQFVLIKGKRYRAVIEEVTTDEIMVAGGNAESGGFRCQVPAWEFAKEPEKGAKIQKMGKGDRMEVLSVVNRNDAAYEILAGDMAA